MASIIVASRNPVKIEATRVGFQQMFPELEFAVEGIEVASGVSDQPMSDEETFQGAMNRLAAARAERPTAQFAVGIEGGIEVIRGKMMAFAWIVIESSGAIGSSRSGTFALPPQVQQLVAAGEELGVANDHVFAQHNSKQQGGAIGLLSNGIIGRELLYSHAVVLALVRFHHQDLFAGQHNGEDAAEAR